MSAFLARSDLSRGDLRLYLRNDLGYAANAYRVRWSIFSKAGILVSGSSLPAINSAVGEYYAPWCSKVTNGCYKILWEYQDSPGCPFISAEEDFFVIEPSAYQCCPNFVCDNGQSGPGCTTFLVGSVLGRGDLPLFLSNSDGVPQNAFAVFWQVLDRNGCPVTQKTTASSGLDSGEYYAEWFVNVLGGDYTIKWEWMEESDSPLQAESMKFSVVSPTALFFIRNGMCYVSPSNSCSPCLIPYQTSTSSSCTIPSSLLGGCSSPCTFSVSTVSVSPPSSQSGCCPFEIARVVHLITQNLPAGGAFTDQPAYAIPSQIRRVAFYITYSRGAVGGRASFRLLWGNGVEETQSTLLDQDFVEASTAVSNQDLYLNDLRGPIPVNANPVNFTIEASVPGGAKTVRILAAEIGVVGAPGVASITLTAAS